MIQCHGEYKCKSRMKGCARCSLLPVPQEKVPRWLLWAALRNLCKGVSLVWCPPVNLCKGVSLVWWPVTAWAGWSHRGSQPMPCNMISIWYHATCCGNSGPSRDKGKPILSMWGAAWAFPRILCLILAATFPKEHSSWKGADKCLDCLLLPHAPAFFMRRGEKNLSCSSYTIEVWRGSVRQVKYYFAEKLFEAKALSWKIVFPFQRRR